MSQQVIEKAKELAGVIAQSPEYITMRATEDAAGQEEALQALDNLQMTRDNSTFIEIIQKIRW